MAVTLQQMFTLKVSGVAKDRVAAAVAIAAQNCLNESGATTNHTNRVAWAKVALADVVLMAEKFIWAVISDTAVQADYPNVTDPDIQNAVNNFINPFSS